mgnify:CR=1 FL=1
MSALAGLLGQPRLESSLTFFIVRFLFVFVNSWVSVGANGVRNESNSRDDRSVLVPSRRYLPPHGLCALGTLANAVLLRSWRSGEHVALVAKAVGENGSLRSVRLNLVRFRFCSYKREPGASHTNTPTQAKNDFARKDCSTFAGFIRQCKNVAYLDLSHNKVHSHVP